MNKEIWKDIVGYEGLYQVSNQGNVKSLDHYASNGIKQILYKGKEIKIQKHKNNYLSVLLSKNGNQKRLLVHRLVAEAFIPNKNKYTCINHKDENKNNNNVENLEWCTHKYNNNYGKNTKWKCKQVIKFSKNNEIIEVYYGVNEAARQNKLNFSHIAQCCRGERKTTGGYMWAYKD